MLSTEKSVSQPRRVSHPNGPVAPPLTRALSVPVAAGVEDGGPTRGQAAGSSWRRSSPGLWVPVERGELRVEQRILEQSMRLRGTGAVTGWAALRMWGGGFFDGLDPRGRELPVPLIECGSRVRPADGVVIRRERLLESEVVMLHGVRCVLPERAVFDEMRRRGDLRAAVGAVDMAAAAELTSVARVRAYTERRRGVRAVAVARAAVELASNDARSPREVDLRLVCVLDAGWRTPLCNRAVLGLDGTFLGTPELLDPDRGVVVEYDGAEHRTRSRHEVDVRREDLFRRAGLEVVTVVGRDLDNRAVVVDRLRSAAARAGGRPRQWMVADPAAPTLDQRLDLRRPLGY